MLCAGLGEAEEGVAAIASVVAAGSGTDLAAGDLAADVVLRAIGMERDVRPLQHHQQLGLVGMQSSQQSIQRDEAGAAAEDAIEPGTQRQATALAGVGPVNPEIGIEAPDQPAHALLSGTLQICESIQLVHQPFRMDPAQGVPADGELPGIVAQHHGIVQEAMRVNAAPLSPLGGNLHGVLDDRHTAPRR